MSARLRDETTGVAPTQPVVDQPPACLAEALVLAQTSDWSAASLPPLLDRLPGWAGQLMAPDRVAWQQGLRQFWTRHGWGLAMDRQLAIFDMACDWDDWPLVIAVGEALDQRRALTDSAIIQLARAYWHMGESEAALTRLYPHLVTAPRDLGAYDLYDRIHAWSSHCHAVGLDDRTGLHDSDLRLEPLGEQHLRDFAWQYQDPSIARLCCLPTFDSAQDWLDWLSDTYGYGDQLLFAVLHRQWGFVGVVSLILHRGVGFFYYWVGADYQGHGFGPGAVSLMLQLARTEYGMHACYAKAFTDNYPSRRGLQKLGFEPMAVRPAPPDDRECFYRLGDAVSASQGIDELRLLLVDMASEVSLCDLYGLS